METIQFAAIKGTDGRIYRAKSHADIIKNAPYGVCKTPNKGFCTSDNRFVTREDALQIAIDSGQIDPKLERIRRPWLFSENFWVDSDYDYEPIHGYFKEVVKNES